MSKKNGSQICVVIGRTRHKMMQIELREAGRRGAQMIELRLDFLAKSPDFKRLLAEKACPLVATVRRGGEGGRWIRSEKERQMLLRQAIVSGFDWVDLETDIADKIPRFGSVKRIVSYHNFRGIPKELEALHMQMCEQDADVVKIAVAAQHPDDNLRVLSLLDNPPKPTVAFCMGEIGFPSRFFGACYGTPFTYAAFNKERGIAPGLPSFSEMRRLFRYEEISDKTNFYGVVGDPVVHSLSPAIHNYALKKLGLPGVYLPMRVPRGELEEFLKAFEKLPLRGLSVTIPHKEAALAIAEDWEETAEDVQAANTLTKSERGWKAFNTDAPAARDSLIAALPEREDGSRPTLEGLSVLVLGAGGVARAVAHVLCQARSLVVIANRTAERAHDLANDLRCRSVDWKARHTILADAVINCTSVGMQPDVDESPVHISYLKPGLIVFDTVYTPENTLLVKEARSRGCLVLTGVDMFIRQAAMQFKLFTGKEAPLDLMEKIVRRELSPVRLASNE